MLSQSQLGRISVVGGAGIALMSYIASGSPVDASPVPSSARPQIQISTGSSNASVHWSTSAFTPTEEDFFSIARALADQQEPLGQEIEQILARHLEDFLD